MDTSLQVPLHGPDGRVLSTQRTDHRHWLIHVESTRDGTRCRHCGREIRDLHGRDAVVRLRHRPWFDVPVCVALRPTRFRGPDGVGHPTTLPLGAWDEPRRPPHHGVRAMGLAPVEPRSRHGRGPHARARQRSHGPRASAPGSLISVGEYDPRSKAAEEMQALFEELQEGL
jgi:transposase